MSAATLAPVDVLLYAAAGAVNGLVLSAMFDSGIGFFGLVLGGILAYALTKVAVKILEPVLKRTTATYTGFAKDIKWMHLIVAGFLDGLVFVLLRPLLGGGMFMGVVAGAFAFYSIEILNWLLMSATM